MRTFYEDTDPGKVFHLCYVFGAIGCIFSLAAGFGVRYGDGELNVAKWKGLALGCLAEAAAIVLIYFLVRLISPWAGVAVLALYVGHVVFVGIYFSERIKEKRAARKRKKQTNGDEGFFEALKIKSKLERMATDMISLSEKSNLRLPECEIIALTSENFGKFFSLNVVDIGDGQADIHVFPLPGKTEQGLMGRVRFSRAEFRVILSEEGAEACERFDLYPDLYGRAQKRVIFGGEDFRIEKYSAAIESVSGYAVGFGLSEQEGRKDSVPLENP